VILRSRANGSLPPNINLAIKTDYIMPALRTATTGAIKALVDNSKTLQMSRIVELGESSVMLVIAE